MSYPGICTTARSAAFITECQTYYKAVWQAIQKAERSVFITGWDIDSRIELLRGGDKPDPGKNYSLLCTINRKAYASPRMRFYLNKWKPSIIYFKERESFPRLKWYARTPSNVHMCLDDVIATGGSHHQKIVIIDDRIAFSGGMDIALGRWDTPDHLPDNPLRTGPIGPYAPYHDLQIALEGEAVRELANLARWRWKRATGFSALPFTPGGNDVWPEALQKQLFNFSLLISQTFPQMKDIGEKREIEEILIHNINKAKDFIYIENQYLTYEPIARFLNERLKTCPDLRILLLSSYNPQGPLEKGVMWQGRINFREILMDGISRDRVRLLCPVSRREDGSEEAIRVHAKLMIVDDRYLHIGSANLNGRSMGHDSECDIVCIAGNEKHRMAITALRNSLIEKFSSTKIEGKIDFDRLLRPEAGKHLILHEIDDQKFAEPLIGKYTFKLGDKAEPRLPGTIDPAAYRTKIISPWRKAIYRIIFSTLVIAMLITAWHLLNQPDSIDWIRHRIEWLFQEHGRSWSSFAIVVAAYTVLTTIGFPVTVLIALTASIFGSLYGFSYAISASMISAAASFGLGSLLGQNVLRALFGPRLKRINDRLEQTGVLQLALLRMVPIAPFGIFNLVSGISGIKFLPYIIGTLLGMVPGTFALSILGDSLAGIVADASPENLAYAAFAISLWIGLIYSMHKIFHYLQKSRK